MTLISALTVHIEKKPGRSFSNSMRDARSWLDHHQITAASFKPVTNAKGGIGFDIGFNIAAEASLSRVISLERNAGLISRGLK